MSMCLQLISINPQDIEKLSLGDTIEELLDEHFEARSDYALDLDKNWDGVDFLFYRADQSSFSRNWLTESGEQIGEDLGYGPARVWTSELVTTITEKTKLRDAASLNAAFDFELFEQAEVYPNIWDQQDPQDRDIILSACSYLQRMLRATTNRGDALLAALV
ncbi:MAG: DUF1877 family protein [Paracoccaceae bacterium]